MTRTATVGELASQVRGVTYKKADASTTAAAGTTGVVRAGNIVNGELTLDDLVFVPDSRISNKQLLRANDVLIAASSGSIDVVGKAARIRSDQTVAFGGFCKVLRPGPEVDPGYFAHYFQTRHYREYVSSVAAGANINNLKNSHLDDIEIPLPPVEEQRRIAAVLDAADSLRAKRRQALAKLDTLSHAIFIEMFGDCSDSLCDLGDVAEIQGGLQVTSKRKSNPIEVPYLRVANVHRGFLDLEEIKTIRVTESELARTELADGDLLVVEGHGNPDEIGRVAIWDGSTSPCVHQNHLIRARCDQGRVLPHFVEAFMNSWVGRRSLLRAANTTSGLNTISTSDVRNVQVPLASMERQMAFRDRLRKVEVTRRDTRLSEAEFSTLFHSLQQRAFRGEL